MEVPETNAAVTQPRIPCGNPGDDAGALHDAVELDPVAVRHSGHGYMAVWVEWRAVAGGDAYRRDASRLVM